MAGGGKKKSGKSSKSEAKKNGNTQNEAILAEAIIAEAARRAQLFKRYLRHRLQHARSESGSSSGSPAPSCLWRGSWVGAVSDGAPALCLLAPDCLVPVAELPDAIRKAGKAGYLRGGLEKRLAEVAAALLEKGPLLYQSPAIVLGSQLGSGHGAANLTAAHEFDAAMQDHFKPAAVLSRVTRAAARDVFAALLHQTLELAGVNGRMAMNGLSGYSHDTTGVVRLVHAILGELRAGAGDDVLPGDVPALVSLAMDLVRRLAELPSAEQGPAEAALGQVEQLLQAPQRRVKLRWPQALEQPFGALASSVAAMQDAGNRAELHVDGMAPGAYPARLSLYKLLSSCDVEMERVAAATVRGHLLLQLVHRAWEEKLEGNCSALQVLVRPLQLAMADSRVGALDLVGVALLLNGPPALVEQAVSTATGSLLSSHDDAQSQFWRQLLLLLLQLAIEGPVEAADEAVLLLAEAEAQPASATDEAAAPRSEQPAVLQDDATAVPDTDPHTALDESVLAETIAALRRSGSPSGIPADGAAAASRVAGRDGEEPQAGMAGSDAGHGGSSSPRPTADAQKRRNLAMTHFLVRRLAPLRRRLAVRILLALQYMAQRSRLPPEVLNVVVDWMEGPLAGLEHGGASPTLLQMVSRLMRQLNRMMRLPIHRLLALYTFVATAFGEAFRTPEDLGGPEPGTRSGREPCPDFAAAALSMRSGMVWVPPSTDTAGGEREGGEGGEAAAGAQLQLDPYAVEIAMHQPSALSPAAAEDGSHAMPGWCFVCSISGPADASAARCLDELAMLAAGQKLMPAMTLDPGLPAQLTRCERLLSGAPVLPLLQGRLLPRLGIPIDRAAQVVDILIFKAAVCHTLLLAIHKAREAVQPPVATVLGMHTAALKGVAAPLPADELKEQAAAILKCADLERLLVVAEKLQAEMNVEALQEQLVGLRSRSLPKKLVASLPELGSTVGEEAAKHLLAEAGAQLLEQRDFWRTQAAKRQQDLAKKAEELCPWANQAKIILSVMAGTSSNSRDLARRLGPAATAATKQEQRVEHLAERLSHAATAAHWRALDVISELRQTAAAYLPGPLEQVSVEVLLADRWEAVAAAAGLAESDANSGAEGPIAEEAGDAAAQAAEAAAAALLEEEKRRQVEEQRRQQEEAERRRAAEQQRRQQQAEERARRRQREEEEEAERRRRKQEEEEAEERREQRRREDEARWRELEGLAAEAALLEQTELDEEARQEMQQRLDPGAEPSGSDADGEEEESQEPNGAAGQQQRQKKHKKSGRQRKREKKLAAAAAAAAVARSEGVAGGDQVAAASPNSCPEQPELGSGAAASPGQQPRVLAVPRLAVGAPHAAEATVEAAAPAAAAQLPALGPTEWPALQLEQGAEGSDAELEAAMLGLGLGSSEAPPPPQDPPANGWADPATALRIAAQAAANRLPFPPATPPQPAPAAPPPAKTWAALAAKHVDPRPHCQSDEAWSFPKESLEPATPKSFCAEAASPARAADPTPSPSPRELDAAALALPGLRNEAGDFNCFLNVVLQCLWRCADFRRQVLSWPLGAFQSDAVLSSFLALFQELTRLDAAAAVALAQRAQQGAARQERAVIDPTPLREALNALPGQEFKLGEMSDAGELLLVLFEHMKGVAPVVAGTAVDAVFGLRVAEAVECQNCGRQTQQSSYTQYFFNSFAAALRSSLAAGPDPGFGARLRRIEDEHKKSCDTDVGGCGTLHPVRQELEGEPPRVFTLQLVWESHEEDPATIGATLRAITEQIDLGQLYTDLMPGTLYRLRAMVCYYGRHYSAFVHLPEPSLWVAFDDASSNSVRTWAAVRQRCESGRLQPSVLFYEAVS